MFRDVKKPSNYAPVIFIQTVAQRRKVANFTTQILVSQIELDNMRCLLSPVAVLPKCRKEFHGYPDPLPQMNGLITN